MNILIATDTYPPQVNGAAQFTYRLAHILHKRGHHVLVVGPSRYWHNETYTHRGVLVVGVASLPLYVNNMRVALPALGRTHMEKHFTKFSPDVVHVQGHFGLSKAIRAIARSQHVPVIGTNHFMPDNVTHYLHLPAFLEDKVNRMLWGQCYTFFAGLRLITTPTKKAAELFTRHGFTKPVQVISNGIDTTVFHPNSAPRAIKEKYRLPNKPLLLTVGRLDKEKNIDVVIRAIAQVRKALDIHFVIVGSDKGSEAAYLKRLTHRLHLDNAVTFTGFVPDEDLPALYTCVDAFIMAGTAELQSIATMEAMASGLPVLAANAVALPELVEPGKNGYLFAPNSVQEASSTILRLFSDTKQMVRMGQRSRARIEQHDLGAVAQIFEKHYQSLLAA